jgi:DNA-binding protein H-NS
MKELIERLNEIDAEKAELEAALAQAKVEMKSSIVEQIRDLLAENGFTADEILPLVAPAEPAKPARVFSTWVMKGDPTKTYTRGVLPGWMKDDMASVGLDPRMGEDRAKFKSEHMVQVQ